MRLFDLLTKRSVGGQAIIENHDELKSICYVGNSLNSAKKYDRSLKNILRCETSNVRTTIILHVIL